MVNEMKKQLFVILNLSLVSGLVILGFNVISPVLPQYALSFNIPIALTGWAVSSFALARVFTDIPAGILSDRFGRKRNMMFGLILVALSSIVTGTANIYTWLIVGRIIQGVGSALYITATTAWIANISAGKYRGRFMSLYSGLIFAGTSFGPSIGGYSAARFGLNAPFFIYGAFAVLGLLATLPLKEIKVDLQGRHSQIRLTDIRQVFLNPSFLIVNSAVFALFFLRAGVRSTLIPLYTSLNFGLSPDKIGILLTVSAITTAVFTYPSGWLSDRIGRKIPIMSCLFVSSFAVVLIRFQDSVSALIPVMILYGFATGLQGSIAAWPADVAPPDKLGTAMGVYRVIGDIGMVLGPITVSYVVGYSGNQTITFLPFLIPAILAFATGLLLIRAKDPAARKEERK